MVIIDREPLGGWHQNSFFVISGDSGLLGSLGWSQGGLLALLGRSWAPFGDFLGSLGCSWGAFSGLLERFVVSWAPGQHFRDEGGGFPAWDNRRGRKTHQSHTPDDP